MPQTTQQTAGGMDQIRYPTARFSMIQRNLASEWAKKSVRNTTPLQAIRKKPNRNLSTRIPSNENYTNFVIKGEHFSSKVRFGGSPKWACESHALPRI